MITQKVLIIMDDKELVTLLKQNSRQSENKVLKQLYGQYFGMVERHILKNSGNQEDVKEVFHDCLIALINNTRKPEFVLTSTLKTYLYSISKRIWLDRLRKMNNKEVPLMEDLNWETADINIDTRIELDEGQKALNEILSNLTGECLKLLKLFYFFRKRMAEIATIIGLTSEKDVKNRKWRCMVKLRKIVSQKPQYDQYLKEYLNDLKST